jgi:hypothetical protein
MPTSLTAYTAERDLLLSRIIETLSSDARIAAAWLEGSFGRGEADEVSDLDLHLAIEDAFSERLCFHHGQANAGTIAERMALIAAFGQPAILHENHANAPAGGSFTFVLYAGSGLMVDWILTPRRTALRPLQSRLLFDKAGIPVLLPEAPESPQERAEHASERIAFFWMMAAVTCKYIKRAKDVKVQWFLDVLKETQDEVEVLVAGDAWDGNYSPDISLAGSRSEQAAALRRLCVKMEELAEQAANLGAAVPPSALPEINILLDLY